ncbi:MAG: bifunctional 2-polyprenyl-6-hydroxyphenol methylase/3-demethylubiquinol 3-O-methyltransferase UbiG [Gammaproteobacteria bacterium]
MTERNADNAELAHFDALASRWWDVDGEFRTLHQLNPLRLEFIQRHAALKGARAVDVGCGGGILSESLALAGAHTTGIDLADSLLEVARLHGIESGIQVEYRHIAAEDMAAESPGSCALVTCMEMLEHVPDPASIVAACAALLKANGVVCFSTLSRTPRAWLLAIVGGEYLTNLIPRGTHDYTRFIRPSELDTWARAAGLELIETAGLHYEPWRKQARLVERVDVNYLAAYRKIAA